MKLRIAKTLLLHESILFRCKLLSIQLLSLLLKIDCFTELQWCLHDIAYRHQKLMLHKPSKTFESPTILDKEMTFEIEVMFGSQLCEVSPR
ncbi:unnamed protein product [Larinioides sclopetarius]|uniref:Uncharacterized protein n=1 Tax=Larinioides sclopetarius TaxID=280406 RepID=A0AAV1Z2S2_9ARAC